MIQFPKTDVSEYDPAYDTDEGEESESDDEESYSYFGTEKKKEKHGKKDPRIFSMAGLIDDENSLKSGINKKVQQSRNILYCINNFTQYMTVSYTIAKRSIVFSKDFHTLCATNSNAAMMVKRKDLA